MLHSTWRGFCFKSVQLTHTQKKTAPPPNPCINRGLGVSLHSPNQTISPPFIPSILFAFSGVCSLLLPWRRSKAQRSPSSSSSSRGKVMESGFCNGALASSSSVLCLNDRCSVVLPEPYRPAGRGCNAALPECGAGL
jgi:hypothetical protein